MGEGSLSQDSINSLVLESSDDPTPGEDQRGKVVDSEFGDVGMARNLGTITSVGTGGTRVVAVAPPL